MLTMTKLFFLSSCNWLSKSLKCPTLTTIATAFVLTGWSPLNAQIQAVASPSSRCLFCHGKVDFVKRWQDGRIDSLFVDVRLLDVSVHSRWNCTDCHSTVTTLPHAPVLERVDCSRCHFSGNPSGAPQGELYDQYRHSVHGRAVATGNRKAPICQDCHGGHNVHRRTDEANPLGHKRVATTCGRCHTEAYAEFRLSVHGTQLESGNRDAPSCINCHGEHDIRPPDDPESAVTTRNVMNTCSACHASEALKESYGVRTVQVETYKGSYHGIAVKFGQNRAASCASCHGHHDILPSSDPKSRIHPANIPATCGSCHPGANANYARGRIHIDAASKDAGIIYYVASFFKYLTIGTLIVLIINIILDLRRRLLTRRVHKS
ncbi:MAG: hypothetical protein FJY67_02290 [Calditrichaeota bacterium]|nr:hypothetical protein [Calditrichota bacterium]